MVKPIAILAADVHYNINTLAVADKAMRQAINHANTLDIPLIVCGDLHDTKANLRGECVSVMINTFKLCKQRPWVIVGNHCRINEKSQEHSLEFLESYAYIVNNPINAIDRLGCFLIPYYSNSNELREYLTSLPKHIPIIMHQGIQGSKSGEYIQDKSAITPQDVAGMRVISGHYHIRQDIELPDGGLWSYVGNPYTLNFGEANDPPKGYQILMDDGSLEFVPTNLRKHVIFARTLGVSDLGDLVLNYEHKDKQVLFNKDDLIWFKLTGPRENLSKIDKQVLQQRLGLPENFRLDLIPTDTSISPTTQKNLSQNELLDSMIDRLSNTDEKQKQRLKELWKGLA